MLPTAGGKKTETGEKKISERQNMRVESVMKEEVVFVLSPLIS